MSECEERKLKSGEKPGRKCISRKKLKKNEWRKRKGREKKGQRKDQDGT